jgi:phospholipid/cholesterol/gamma-HCH transport system ATP-binding protein
MITFKDINKSFDNKKIINGISGTFETAKVNMLVGPSGTGKSILMKCIVGLVEIDRGSIYFDEHNFSDAKTRFFLRKAIGMLFQGGALFDSKNVQQNVTFPLDVLTKMTTKEKLYRANFCLEKVGLTNANKKMPSEISGGMKKRVGLARAIVNNPKYLFVDEPNSGLDPKSSSMVDKLIQDLTYEYGMTTVLVSHDINSMINIGDNIIFLNKGEKAWEGKKQDVFNSKQEQFNSFLLSNSLAKMMMEKINSDK